MNIKEYIKKKIKEYDPTIDTSIGSPVGDLFINPLSAILKETLDFKETILNNLSISDAGSISESDLDAIAENFLVERTLGETATGSIRLFYDTPVSVTISKGTLFSNNDGYMYKTSAEFSITSEGMAKNLESYPLYHTGDIPIKATEAGIEYTTKANTIKNIVSNITPEPVSIKNVTAIVSTVDKETNQQLKNKILSSFTTKSLASPNGINRSLKEVFPSISSLSVVSAGSEKMLRDINYSRTAAEDRYISDFNAKISGLSSAPYNQSIAYGNRFQDTISGIEVSLPDPSDFTYEFTNTMYAGIYTDQDTSYAEVSNILLNEQFNSEETATGYNRYWVTGDGSLGRTLKTVNEITVENSSIKLGSIVDENVTQNNLSPVMQIPLSKHTGIQIEGEFKTNDSTDGGEISYVTVKRNSELSVPYDGYGLAWRKGDGSKYNVYIVDNDALNTDTFVNEQQIWDQSGGVNRFLSAGKKEILSGTWYKFVINIYDKNGMDVWVYDASSVPELTDSNKTISIGQSYPPYISQSSGDHFGFGVLETKNSEWWYRELKITDIGQSYPMHLFKIKCSSEYFQSNNPITLTYVGAGWGESYKSLKWYVRNLDTGRWEKCGESSVDHEKSPGELKMVKSLNDIDPYRNSSDQVTVLATPYNYLDEEHNLRTHYVSATNTTLSGVHTGNCVDVYINDKNKITHDTHTVSLYDTTLILKTEGDFNLPILDIDSITKTTTGRLLVENTDYVVLRPNEGTAFSTNDNIKIVFDGAFNNTQVNINYRYYSDGDSVQELIESDEYRYPGQNNLIKVYPYSVVKISSFRYRGPVAEEVIQSALIKFINNISDGSLEISDLINVAYTAGANFVDTLNLSVKVKDQNYLGTYFEENVDGFYVLSGDLKTYFSDEYSIYGVTKLD